jgi:hypothetical protein
MWVVNSIGNLPAALISFIFIVSSRSLVCAGKVTYRKHFCVTTNMPQRTRLNISYKQVWYQLDIKAVDSITLLKEAIEKTFAKKFPEMDAVSIRLFHADRATEIKYWPEIRRLDDLYFKEQESDDDPVNFVMVRVGMFDLCH